MKAKDFENYLETTYRQQLQIIEKLDNLSNQVSADELLFTSKLEALDAAILDIPKK